MDEALKSKTAATANLNAISILVVAGLATLLSLLQLDLATAAFGLALCGASALELGGARRLRADPAAALPLLVGGELGVMVVIVAYSAWRLSGFDFDAELAALPAQYRELLLGMVGGDQDLLRVAMTLTHKLTYWTLLVVTVAYQGGMMLFYRRRIARITAGEPA